MNRNEFLRAIEDEANAYLRMRAAVPQLADGSIDHACLSTEQLAAIQEFQAAAEHRKFLRDSGCSDEECVIVPARRTNPYEARWLSTQVLFVSATGRVTTQEMAGFRLAFLERAASAPRFWALVVNFAGLPPQSPSVRDCLRRLLDDFEAEGPTVIVVATGVPRLSEAYQLIADRASVLRVAGLEAGLREAARHLRTLRSESRQRQLGLRIEEATALYLAARLGGFVLADDRSVSLHESRSARSSDRTHGTIPSQQRGH